MIPPSFDSLILSDQLFKVIKSSPQTKHLISLRAEEIIKEIMQKPIQIRLNKQIQMCRNLIRQQQANIQSLEEELKQIKNSKQKSQKKIKKNMAQKLTQNANLFIKLQGQLNQKDKQVSELDQYKQELQKQLQRYSNQVQSKQQQILSLKGQIEVLAGQKAGLIRQIQSGKQHKNDIDQMIQKLKLQLELRQKDIQSVNNSVQKLRREHKAQLKQVKMQHEEFRKSNNQQILKLRQAKQKARLQLVQNQTDYQLLKKQIDVFRTKYAQFSQQQKQIKQSSARQISNLHTQIRHLSKCLSQSDKQNSRHQLKLKKLQRVSLKVKQLESQIKINRVLFQQQIKLLKQQCGSTISQITDKIGGMINIDLQAYLQKLIRYKQQINIYRQQKKIKDQIIQKLQRMLQTQTNGTMQLKNQLRIKKKQEQRLRKQLKRNYQQNDFKLQSIEKKYMQLLQDTTNYP